jgi:sugar lactone lactonase YvrE
VALRPALVRRLHGPDALLSLAPSGERELHARFEDDTPCGLGVLPDGKIVVLTMFRKRLMTYADGQLSLYADLSGIAAGTIDDMIVDGLGRAYVGDLGFDLPPPPDRGPVGRIILVTPDGETRVVADGLRFPNGIAVSADNRRLVVAEMDGECLAEYDIDDIEPDGGLKFRGRFGNMKSPDGICLDHERAVWVASFDEDGFIRVGRDGRELQRIEVPRPPCHCLCSRRPGAADTVLPECRDLARTAPATPIACPHRRGRCRNSWCRLSLSVGGTSTQGQTWQNPRRLKLV